MDHSLADPRATSAADAPAWRLPAFIEPMLAKPGEPFDSGEHLFEIKWDGTRALAFIEAGQYRLLSRHRLRRRHPRHAQCFPLEEPP